MIKITSMVEAHFFLVRPGMFGHQIGAQRAPQNSTGRTIWAPHIVDSKWDNPIHLSAK